jgi:hypothetical protein
MATFNGYTIVPVPSVPGSRSVEFTATDAVGAVVSPFTGQQQIQSWQAAWLGATVSMPPMKDSLARAWVAFLLSCNGVQNIFQLGDPMRKAPQGSGAGAPVVNGSDQTGFTLATSGWTPSAAGVLLPGDCLQIGYRLYNNVYPVNADGSGEAIITIWPNLRESPADTTSIVLANTMGIWRLADNARHWSISAMKTYGVQFKIREAI